MTATQTAEPLHIVEPTLVDQTGHCHSFVSAVCAAGPEQRFEVWAGLGVETLDAPGVPVTLRPHFGRKLRRVQQLLLLRRLLRSDARVFLPTAGATDLTLLSFAAPRGLASGQASAFVHWMRPSASRARRLAAAAKRAPRLRVLAPTREIFAMLRTAGFADARQVPYPLTPSAKPSATREFRHLLFAGAARMDKGFDRVVDLAEQLAASKAQIPLAVQTSAKHYGKIDPDIARELTRLDRIAYSALERHSQTLDRDAYFALFRGAICLLPYVREEFAGRVSAVTVDALACGAPLLTTEGTWMAEQVQRFGAGLTLKDPSGPELHAAAKRLIEGYAEYSESARRAAEVIHREHAAVNLLRAVIAPA